MSFPVFSITGKSSDPSGADTATSAAATSTEISLEMDPHDQRVAKIIVISILSAYSTLALVTILAWLTRFVKRQWKLQLDMTHNGMLRRCYKAEMSMPSPVYSMENQCGRNSFILAGYKRHQKKRNLSRIHSPAHPLALGPQSLELERTSISLDLDRNSTMMNPKHHVSPYSTLNSQARISRVALITKISPAHLPIHKSRQSEKFTSRPRPAPVIIIPYNSSPLSSPSISSSQHSSICSPNHQSMTLGGSSGSPKQLFGPARRLRTGSGAKVKEQIAPKPPLLVHLENGRF